MKKFICSVLFAVMLVQCIPAYSQSDRPADVDSVLYAYFLRCSSRGKEPVVLKIADTLFRLAGQKGDVRMQAAALSYKTDYYYFNDMKDSMLARMKICQDFSRRHNQPKYYYFAWTRLVSYYRNKADYNLALFELNKMFAHAKKEGYKEAIYQCEVQLANIYLLKLQYEVSIDYYRKALEYSRENGLEDYNRNVVYSNLAQALIGCRKYQSALEALDSLEYYAPTVRTRSSADMGRFQVLLAQGKAQEAWSYFEKIKRQSETAEGSTISQSEILKAQVDYYDSTRQYAKAMDFLRQREEVLDKLGRGEKSNLRWASLYGKIGDTTNAYKRLKDYVEDRLFNDTRNTRAQLEEFATMMEVDRLAAEKNQLQLAKQHDKLVYNRKLITALSCLLILGLVFIFFQNRSNRRLRRSKSDLLIAVERMEKANEMKSVFIQNISHEVRTPLNAIAGFSELIASLAQGKEAEEYAAVVRRNNASLLGLMDDILCISDLDSSPSTMNKEKVNPEVCCNAVLGRVSGRLKEGVELVFSPPPGESVVIFSSRRGIETMLFCLMDNAAKFTEKGSIELSYDFSSEGKVVTFSVTDTGSGIPEGWEEKIFERFVKIDTFNPGLGLGLSISRIMAEKLGGTLVLDREYTSGSRFVLTLPTEM